MIRWHTKLFGGLEGEAPGGGLQGEGEATAVCSTQEGTLPGGNIVPFWCVY